MRDKDEHTRKFLARIATPDVTAFGGCLIPGCGRKPQARSGRGASHIYCDRCCRHRNRHGDLVKSTYRAAQLEPYMLAAQQLIARRHQDVFIVTAEANLTLLLQYSGTAHRIADYQYLPPHAKARA